MPQSNSYVKRRSLSTTRSSRPGSAHPSNGVGGSYGAPRAPRRPGRRAAVGRARFVPVISCVVFLAIAVTGIPAFLTDGLWLLLQLAFAVLSVISYDAAVRSALLACAQSSIRNTASSLKRSAGLAQPIWSRSNASGPRCGGSSQTMTQHPRDTWGREPCEARSRILPHPAPTRGLERVIPPPADPRLEGRCRGYHAHSSAFGERATSGRVDRAGVPGSWLAAVEVR